MSKRKSITLLSIISVVVAILLVLTFARFPIGEIKEYKSALGAIELDYDIEGGTAYTLTLASDNEEEVEDVNDVISVLEYRLSALGYSVYTVKAVKSVDSDVLDYDIRIETKTTETLASDIAVVSAYGEVKFFGGTSANPTEEIMDDIKVVAGAEYLGMTSDGTNTYYQVAINFTDQAHDVIMDKITEAESGEGSFYLEIKLNDTVLLSGSSALDKSYFNGNTLYITSQNEASAKQMVLQMQSGGLAYKYDLSDPVSVSSPYGDDLGLKISVVIAVMSLAIMVALILMYKGFGIVSALSVLLFILIETWMLIAVPGITLSLGGVVGIILATVLCAYALFLTSARVKEEYAHSEKTVRAAINKGFKSSLVPVISAHVVSGLVVIALLAFTSGIINNFAVTFGIGVVVSAIASLVFSRMFTALILPLAKDKEKFLNTKKAEV